MLTKSVMSFFVVGIAYSAGVWATVFKFKRSRQMARAHKAKTFLAMELAQSVLHGVSTPTAIAVNAGSSVLNAAVLIPWAVFDATTQRRKAPVA